MNTESIPPRKSSRGWLLATVGTAIAPDSPTVTGTVTGYSVTPTLPTSLSLEPYCRHDLKYTERRRSSGELYRCGLECHSKDNRDAANFRSDTGTLGSLQVCDQAWNDLGRLRGRILPHI
jgi:hypothetical protein